MKWLGKMCKFTDSEAGAQRCEVLYQCQWQGSEQEWESDLSGLEDLPPGHSSAVSCWTRFTVAQWDDGSFCSKFFLQVFLGFKSDWQQSKVAPACGSTPGGWQARKKRHVVSMNTQGKEQGYRQLNKEKSWDDELIREFVVEIRLILLRPQSGF